MPPDPEYFSPYSGLDANCGNPLLIDLDALIAEGLLSAADAPPVVADAGAPVDFDAAAAASAPALSKAARALLTEPRFAVLRGLMAEFRTANPWIEDSALFDALRRTPELADADWWTWPKPLRFREPDALHAARTQHSDAIEEYIAVQFLFDRQWRALKVQDAANDDPTCAAPTDDTAASAVTTTVTTTTVITPRCACYLTPLHFPPPNRLICAGVRQLARRFHYWRHAYLCGWPVCRCVGQPSPV